jgi:hypothetical protein
MFFELIAAIVAGALVAGVVFGLNRLTGGRLPRWVMPAAAGAAIVAYAIFMEYSWYGRTVATLPEGLEVTFTHEARNVWRPWTFARPVVDRFAAVDRAAITAPGADADQRRAELYLFGRWTAPRRVPVVYDCGAGRMAPLLETVQIDENGVVTQADWEPVPADDPTLSIVCKEA